MPGTDRDPPGPVVPHAQGPTHAETEPSVDPAPKRRPQPEGGDRPVLPDVTSDERDIGWGDWPDSGDDDRYLREVPPHHGG